jgi:hypothetical protein
MPATTAHPCAAVPGADRAIALYIEGCPLPIWCEKNNPPALLAR